jgi:transcriptional regulator with XRE-family HTH domain
MKLVDYLKKHELSQSNFANKAGLTDSTVSRVLKNRGYNPGIKVVAKIVEHTNGEVDYRDFV